MVTRYVGIYDNRLATGFKCVHSNSIQSLHHACANSIRASLPYFIPKFCAIQKPATLQIPRYGEPDTYAIQRLVLYFKILCYSKARYTSNPALSRAGCLCHSALGPLLCAIRKPGTLQIPRCRKPGAYAIQRWVVHFEILHEGQVSMCYSRAPLYSRPFCLRGVYIPII
jgi:hypothetical protein